MLPFIAYDYIASVAPSQFDSWYKTFPTNVRKDIMRQFRNNPIEGVRMALAYAVREKMRTKKISIEAVDNNSDSNTAETAEVTMKYNGKPATSKWIKEQGEWRLTELSFFHPKSYLSQSIIDKDYEYMNTLSFSYTHNLLNIGKPLVSMFGVSYNYMFNAFVVAEINFKKGKTFLPESGERYKMDIAGLSIGGQLPLALGKWRLVPYLGAYYKMAIGDVFRDYIGLSWGADLVYPLGQVAGVFVGVRYNTIPYIPGRFNLNQELYLGFAL